MLKRKVSRMTRGLVSVALAFGVMLIGTISAPADARGSNLSRQTDDLVKAVQNALMSQGKWPPPAGSNEMQLCTALQYFSQQAKNAPDLNGGNLNNNEMMAMQSLASSASQVDAYIGTVGFSSDVSSRWINIKGQIGNGMGFGGFGNNGFGQFNRGYNPYNYNSNSNYNSGFNPGFNPYNSNNNNNRGIFGSRNNGVNLDSYVNNLNSDMRDFSNLCQKSAMSGGFANAGAMFGLTTSLQNLQNAVKRNGRGIADSNNVGQQQNNLNQLSFAVSQFEQQFQTAQPNPMLSARWMQFKTTLNSLQQAVFNNSMMR